MQHQYNIHALHGFLGNPGDWSSIENQLGHSFQTYSLFNDFPILPFADWAEKFNQHVHLQNSLSNNILMGYSLGGRLGLHALLQNPQQWKAAILVSTNTGFNSVEDRFERIGFDEAWATRFENEPWDDLMNAWNAQSIFKSNACTFQRKESENDRNKLAAALRMWSLGLQQDQTDNIASLDMPILWMVGENDAKYLAIAQKLRFKHPKSKLCIVANAGHRLHFEQTEIYKQNVTQFIKNL